jgi:hypothetical protein
MSIFPTLAKQAQENYNLGHFGGFSYGFFTQSLLLGYVRRQLVDILPNFFILENG